MIMLDKDGSLIWNSLSGAAPDKTAGTLELPVNLLAQQSDLLDRIFAFAFDVLGLHKLDIRIRAHAEYTAGASASVRRSSKL